MRGYLPALDDGGMDPGTGPVHDPDCIPPAEGHLVLSSLLGFVGSRSAGRDEHGSMADHPEPWSSPFTQVELRGLWTYSDGALTVKGYRLPGGTPGAEAGYWSTRRPGTSRA
jgi:hypothetical protein